MSITSVSVPSTVTTVTAVEITKFLQSWHLLLIQLLIINSPLGQARATRETRHPCELFVSHYFIVGLKD
jgi:ABC-type glycerol-3-phosphate transport system permease component